MLRGGIDTELQRKFLSTLTGQKEAPICSTTSQPAVQTDSLREKKK